MSVAELQGDGIVADATQSRDDDPGEAARPVAAPSLPEDVDLTHVLGAGRKLTEQFGPEALLATVLPGDGDEITDNLKVSRRPHGSNLNPGGRVASREQDRRVDLDSPALLGTLV